MDWSRLLVNAAFVTSALAAVAVIISTVAIAHLSRENKMLGDIVLNLTLENDELRNENEKH